MFIDLVTYVIIAAATMSAGIIVWDFRRNRH